MSDTWEGIITTAAGALAVLVIQWLIRKLGKTFKKSSPVMDALGEIIPAVNFLIGTAGPQMLATIALLEAMQGKNNDNVTHALSVMREQQVCYDSYNAAARKIEPVCS